MLNLLHTHKILTLPVKLWRNWYLYTLLRIMKRTSLRYRDLALATKLYIVTPALQCYPTDELGI